MIDVVGVVICVHAVLKQADSFDMNKWFHAKRLYKRHD